MWRSSNSPEARAMLVCRVDDRLCAVPVGEIVETMRPLPVSPLPHAQRFVAGVARVRGAPVPVLDARALMGAAGPPRFGRLVILRAGDRRVALAVDAVVGVRWIPAEALHPLPPLLSAVDQDAVAAIAALDSEVLVVLGGGRLLREASLAMEAHA